MEIYNASDILYKLYRISDDLLIQRNKKVSAAPQPFYSSEISKSSEILYYLYYEKYFIMFKPEGANMNSRTEFFGACRHKAKLLL